ncbi:MAG TPA: hypothetical protein VL371_19855 [Gemmataceae bacterium]|nr:hypothetical protein [Gemmataceae bacterium]
MSRSGWFEADPLADGVGEGLEDAGMFGKDPAVLEQNCFNPGEPLIGLIEPLIDPSLKRKGLGLKGRLVLDQLRLGPDERRHGLVEFVDLPVTLTATFGHATAPMCEPSFYQDEVGIRGGTAVR